MTVIERILQRPLEAQKIIIARMVKRSLEIPESTLHSGTMELLAAEALRFWLRRCSEQRDLPEKELAEAALARMLQEECWKTLFATPKVQRLHKRLEEIAAARAGGTVQ